MSTALQEQYETAGTQAMAKLLNKEGLLFNVNLVYISYFCQRYMKDISSSLSMRERYVVLFN